MGRNNQARRAAEARARSRSQGRTPPPPADGEAEVRIGSLLFTAARAALAGHPDAAVAACRDLAAVDLAELTPPAEELLRAAVAAAWELGWQPAEVHREVRRTCGAAPARLVAAAIEASHEGHDRATLHARWAAQLEALGAHGTSAPGWVLRWARAEGVVQPELTWEVAGVLACLFGLPPIERILPPPGASDAEAGAAGAAFATDPHDPVLAKVRALLAQAESTTFEAEAETFTAKAHALMTRHAIDAARLGAAGSASGEQPITVRIPVDDPYASAKARLLHEVATASRCRAVHLPSVGLDSVVGFPSDIAAVELLFTSLLVQAQTSLGTAGRTAPPGARTRSRRFRSSFLLSYAVRIGQRLEEVNASVLSDAEAETGAALVPVMEERDQVVDDAFHERFPHIRRVRSNPNIDPLGWVSGEQAADLAKLTSAELAG